jgi:hypothetical protein
MCCGGGGKGGCTGCFGEIGIEASMAFRGSGDKSAMIHFRSCLPPAWGAVEGAFQRGSSPGGDSHACRIIRGVPSAETWL